MSFAPDKSAEDKGRINAVEDYLSLLTERIKFCFNGIDENIAQKSDGKEEKQLIYSTIADEVGQLTATGIGCEIFNDYENNIASSLYAHAEGSGTKATAPGAHAEGNSTTASSTYAHAEGYSTEASGEGSHAEGEKTTASGYCSHAEGYNATASGGYSHAEGYNAVASGWYSHAGGINSEAKAEASFAHGEYAVSNYRGGAAFGIMNKTKDALFVVGNGSPRGSYESDALVLDDGGNLWVAGSIKCGGDSGGYTLSPATADTLGGVMIGDNISVTADGTISVDLSGYLKADEISEWAKAENKPAYTASEIGLGNVDNTADADKPISTATQTALDGKADTEHTHTVSDITDMPAYLTEETDPTVPAWAKAESKPVYTAEEVGAVTPYELDSKDYLKATEISGQTIDLNDITMNTASDKGKSRRYFCTSLSAQNIENRPISANEPFELSVDNIRNINTEHFNTIQRYTSVARKRTYTRWCNDGAWSAWKCDTDVVVYGSVTEDSPKTFAYATYGEGFGVVEIEAYYDNATNPVRNRKVFALSPTASIERVMLTISNGSSESVTLANGTITMSMTGTTALSFVIRYTNSR